VLCDGQIGRPLSPVGCFHNRVIPNLALHRSAPSLHAWVLSVVRDEAEPEAGLVIRSETAAVTLARTLPPIISGKGFETGAIPAVGLPKLKVMPELSLLVLFCVQENPLCGADSFRTFSVS